MTAETTSKTETASPSFQIPPDQSAFDMIEQAKAKYYADPNVIGVGIANRRVGQRSHDDEIALVIYVKEKLPVGEIRPEFAVDAEFNGMGTDVVAPFGADAPREALGFQEGHHHSDDMGFIDWPRLHEQWLAEAGGTVEWHGSVQNHGDICVVEDDGTLVKTVGGSQTVDWVQAYKLFRSRNADVYDFVTFITDSDTGMPPQGGSSWYRFVFNDTQGIGLGNFDQRSAYGSSRLQGIIFMNQGHFPIWRYVMLQEQGHRWASFAKYRTSADGPNRTDHLLGGWGHWTLDFDDDQSPMDYDIYDWVADNGNFRRMSLTSEERVYCNLDLYLMGLLGYTEVGDFNLLSDVSLISGNEYSATVRSLDIENIRWAEGPRVPSVGNAQKTFKHAFVVLTGDIEASHDLIDEVDALRLRFERDFYEATKRLGRVDTTLGPLRGDSRADFRTVSVPIPEGTGARSIERVVSFSGPVRRAAVALNGFKFDYASSDHHINVIEADTDVIGIDGFDVRIRVQAQYADKNFDDRYSGYITAVVMADVV